MPCIFCRNCGRRIEVLDADDRPSHCMGCGMPNPWRNDGDPIKDYALSQNDRRFLKSLRINDDE